MWAENGISKLILKYFFENNQIENECVAGSLPDGENSTTWGRLSAKCDKNRREGEN